MNEKEFQISVYCPVCKKRAIDKLSPTQGKVRIKCPHCKNLIVVDLSFRLNYNPNKYRTTRSA